MEPLVATEVTPIAIELGERGIGILDERKILDPRDDGLAGHLVGHATHDPLPAAQVDVESHWLETWCVGHGDLANEIGLILVGNDADHVAGTSVRPAGGMFGHSDEAKI